MTLREAIEQYILWRQAHGAKFTTGANLLRQLPRICRWGCRLRCGHHGAGSGLSGGRGSAYPASREQVLRPCRLLALCDQPRPCDPLAAAETTNRDRPSGRRRISTRATSCGGFLIPRPWRSAGAAPVQLDAVTFRTLLLLLYGAGLRFSEATRLTLADVDLAEAVLTIRATKFYKSRLVPIGPQLATVLGELHASAAARRLAQGEAAFLLANRDGTRLASSTVQAAFDALRRIAGVHGTAGGRQIPRLHDLRHSFAVHSLTAWYRQGADVQRLLPVLSTYLGHSDLEGTKVYLSMTPELLQQASLRFARYADGGQRCLIS